MVGIKGLLEVRTDAHVWSSSVDMRFDLCCSANTATASTANATATITAAAAAAAAAAGGIGSTTASRINSQEHQTSSKQQPEGSW